MQQQTRISGSQKLSYFQINPYIFQVIKNKSPQTNKGKKHHKKKPKKGKQNPIPLFKQRSQYLLIKV